MVEARLIKAGKDLTNGHGEPAVIYISLVERLAFGFNRGVTAPSETTISCV